MNRIAPSCTASSFLPAAAPGRLTVLAAMLAGLSAPALAASDVVISQVYGGGGNAGATLKHDFIELFNRSAAPVALNGWSVQYASAANSNWSVTALTDVTLAPGQYYLVQQAAGAGGTPSTVAADKVGTIAMGGTAGKVALSNSVTPLTAATQTGALDLVGYGSSATPFEGAGPTAGLGNPTAAQRNDEGCADSDNNNLDFTVLAPAPRNRQSPLRVCGTPIQKPIVALCPSTLALAQGYAGSAELSASDADGLVNSAAITSATVPGIVLGAVSAAETEGGSATVSLRAGAGVPVGSYPVNIEFGNNQAQHATCKVTVQVSPLAAVSAAIPAIQGPGATSPLNNSVQTTEGVVTLKVGTGFFIQDPAGDGNPDSSDGLFVYVGNGSSAVGVGDLVRVTGSVFEFTPSGANRSYTELKDITAVVPISSGHSVTPTIAELGGSSLPQLEGMLVQFPQALTVSQAEYLGTRGELTLSAGRLEVPTNRYPARSPEALALAAANAANMIVLDDGIFVTPAVIPYIGQDGTVRAGDTISGLTGVIDFGAIGGGGAAFKLQPSAAPLFSRDNPRTGAPQLAPGNVKVASANVLNFFTTFTNGGNVLGQTGQGCKLGSATSAGNCRGADNLNEFNRQRDKIVAELKAIDADVYGLMEIQNNGEYAVTNLKDALNAAIGAPVYAVVPAPAATGTDAIRVAMLYKPSRLALAGAALSDGHAVNNRPPMAQTFKAANGAKFSLIVNHLKSKGSCPSGSGADADLGDSQSCWNATRIEQAQRLVQVFAPQVAAAAGDADVLLIGDMNSYGMEDPIAAMLAAGYVNELERHVRPLGMPYSYIFGGHSGYLDHALASTALSPQVAGAAEWHVNADEPTVIDYNTDGKPQDLYNALAYRASDHDPVVISLNLAPSFVNVTSSFGVVASGLVLNRASGKFTGTVKLTNTSGSAIAGALQFELAGLPAGVTLDNASGQHDGSPYITLNSGALAPGASITIPLTFSNPAKGPMSYSTRIYTGTF